MQIRDALMKKVKYSGYTICWTDGRKKRNQFSLYSFFLELLISNDIPGSQTFFFSVPAELGSHCLFHFRPDIIKARITETHSVQRKEMRKKIQRSVWKEREGKSGTHTAIGNMIYDRVIAFPFCLPL